MMRSRYVHLILVLLLLSPLGCESDDLPSRVVLLPIGDDSVQLVIHDSGQPGLRYVVLHDDENTAVAAAQEAVKTHGGALYELRHSGERNVRFSMNGMTYRFDPNRIFTPIGAARTLDRWTEATVEPLVARAVSAFADSLLTHLMLGYDGLIVAVHNNTDEGYTVHSYESGGDLSLEARTVHVAADQDEDDFVFATTPQLYHRARDAGLHAVLQRMPPATDDGSLSVYAARAGIPYVNVEAEHGHLEQQTRMLDLIARSAQP